MGVGAIDPVQTYAYNLHPSDNPIIFGSGTNIDCSATSAVRGESAGWNVSNFGTIIGYWGIALEGDSTVTNAGTISSNSPTHGAECLSSASARSTTRLGARSAASTMASRSSGQAL